jgi:RNA polymerase sigma-70 factor, ECF subfamily
MPKPQHEVTRLLAACKEGDGAAYAELMPLVYDELRRIAAGRLRRERPGHTLQPTALVHEAYLKLAGGEGPAFADRAHFFGIAARLMRQILVDHARGRGREKRGGDMVRVTLDDRLVEGAGRDLDVLALEEALTALAAADESLVRVVELRFYGGLSVEETAEALGVSPATVKRDWVAAKTFLKRELTRESSQ